MHPEALADSAALALSAGTRTLSVAVGAVVLAIAWGVHHRLAHHHRLLTLAAFLGMIAGSVILFAGAGASLLQWVNGDTADWLGGIARWARLGGGWPRTIGLLTLVEIVLIIWTGSHVYDAASGRGRRSARGGAAAPSSLGTLGARGAGAAASGRSWQWLEHQFHRYGWFAVGPMTVTLPGAAGALCAVPFALLAGAVGHAVGSWFGIG